MEWSSEWTVRQRHSLAGTVYTYEPAMKGYQMIDLQLLDSDGCTVLRGRKHYWNIIDKLDKKDVYVWGLCQYCFRVRLFKYNMPRKKSSRRSATFKEEEGSITPVQSISNNQFCTEVDRRKIAEAKYFRRDEIILKFVFNVI